jgi:hypothetical protein
MTTPLERPNSNCMGDLRALALLFGLSCGCNCGAKLCARDSGAACPQRLDDTSTVIDTCATIDPRCFPAHDVRDR